MEHNKLDIFELIRIMAASRILIITIVAVVAIAAVAYSLLTPEIYSSGASFFAVGDQLTQLPFDIPGLSGLASKFLGGAGGTQNAENFITVLQSRTISEELIHKFKLIEYFEKEHPDSLRNLDDALVLLHQKVLSTDYDSGTGLVKIRASTKDKQLSLDIINFLLERLDRYNREQKLTQGKLNRQFLESRVDEVKGKLDSLIVANQKFQEGSKVIHLETQAKAMVESYSALIAEGMKTDIELEMARASYSADSPVVQELMLRKSGIQRQIHELEASGDTPQYLLNIGKIPKATAEFLRLEMDMQIYKTLFEYLYPQYEAARLSELRDMPTIEVLDSPRLAGRRDYPKRALICALATIIGFIFAVILALIIEIIRRNQARFSEIKATFKK